jgi:CBS domain-containing protein
VTGNLRLARRTTVAATQDLLGIEPLLVRADTDLLAAMRIAAGQPSTRNMGVVDASGRLTGIVRVAALAEAVVAHAVPEVFFAGAGDIDEIGKFGQALEATTIGEIARKPAAITGERTLADAFRIMHERHVSGLYVVDADGRPTGYLDLQELAMRYVEALEAERGTRHDRVSDVLDPPASTDV